VLVAAPIGSWEGLLDLGERDLRAGGERHGLGGARNLCGEDESDDLAGAQL
jgi:hypothetical protein